MMATCSEVESLQRSADRVDLPDQFFRDYLKIWCGSGESAALVLDDHGEVLYCNDNGAAVFSAEPQTIVAKPVTELVPDIGIKRWATGSNVVRAAYSGRRNIWRPYHAMDDDGRSFPVEILLDVLVVDLRYFILLWIRTPVKQVDRIPAVAPSSINDRSYHGVYAA